MRIIFTDQLTPHSVAKEGETIGLWIYNGLDCCVTHECFSAIEPQFDNLTRSTYEFSKALQGPVMEMGLRGVKSNAEKRNRLIRDFEKDIKVVQANFNRIMSEGFGIELNHRSPAQLRQFFYGTLRIPEIRKRNAKGEMSPTVNRDALEKLTTYFDAELIANHILFLRDLEKKVSALKTEVDPDGRIRTSYNIGGTTTGRLSSSESIYGTGGNLQNLEERLRSHFESDPGMKFAYIDLEQAESRVVGAICYNAFGMSNYLDSCESGDLHTTVVKMCWPTAFPWTGDRKKDKELAEQPFYRQHSYRHMCKVLGHGSNYGGQPYTMSKHTKIDVKAIKEFQGAYFAGFPEIPMWHGRVRQTLLEEGKLISLMGRKRCFFGRRNEDTTVREAIAFDPQSSVADILDTAMLRIWRAQIVQLLLQVHDALLIQYPEDQEDEILPQVMKMMEVPVELRNGRILLIPAEAQVGWNWSKKSENNPDGLVKYVGHDSRKRSPETSVLDTIVL